MHKRVKTTKTRLNNDENDKKDEGDTDNIDNIGEVKIVSMIEAKSDGNTSVNKHVKSFQIRIDEQIEGERLRYIERTGNNKTKLGDQEKRKNDNGETKEKQDE
eukprot:16439558-Heterocapsa_arctica.AAC.1